jgi:hypothetical protein
MTIDVNEFDSALSQMVRDDRLSPAAASELQMLFMKVSADGAGKLVKAAVEAERSRCSAIAYAMRCGEIDDIRSVIGMIDSGSVFESEEEDD